MTPDHALSLANDIQCAIAALKDVSDALMTAYPSEDYRRDEPEPVSAPAEPPKPEVTLEMVRTALAEKSREGHREAVLALLKKYGAERLSAIAPENYADLLAEAGAIK
jgi:hypothetical protein